MDAFKSHLQSPARYPYAPRKASIKLDQNESPYDLPLELKREALRRLEELPWNRYPSLHAEELRARLARQLGCSPDELVISPGSNLLIQALSQAARQVLDLSPSFSYYGLSARMQGTPYRAFPLREGFQLPVDELQEALREPSVCFIPNPHAPTGTLFPHEDLEVLIEAAEQGGSLLVIDEAYYQFAGTDSLPLTRRSAHVALLRTFSKAWGLGGLRAGYLVAPPTIAALIQELIPPFCLPALTTAVLEVVLEHPEYSEQIAARIRSERERLYQALLKHPSWIVYPSAANFLLVRTPDAQAAFEALLQAGILVRRQDHYPQLEGCLRVTVGEKIEKRTKRRN
jgi:histidinol-phosphate aminotransferase